MTLYFDTSALAKLIIVERESSALRRWMSRRRAAPIVTNIVGVVELQRLAARVSHEAAGAATVLLARVDHLELTPGALATAAHLPPPEERTLDALHVASASELGDLDAVVTYDLRMADTARRFGLPVVSPGTPR